MSTFSPPSASPLLLVFKSDKGHFLGLLDNQRLQDLIASTSLQTTSSTSTLSPEELEVEMLDQQQIPQYRVKLRVTFHFSQVTKAQMIRQNQQMVVNAKAVE
jgi:hypothetical protein